MSDFRERMKGEIVGENEGGDFREKIKGEIVGSK